MHQALLDAPHLPSCKQNQLRRGVFCISEMLDKQDGLSRAKPIAFAAEQRLSLHSTRPTALHDQLTNPRQIGNSGAYNVKRHSSGVPPHMFRAVGASLAN